jgi:hypothetical protein
MEDWMEMALYNLKHIRHCIERRSGYEDQKFENKGNRPNIASDSHGMHAFR